MIPAAFAEMILPEKKSFIRRGSSRKIVVVRTIFFVLISGHLPHLLLFHLANIAEKWQLLRTRRKGCEPPPSEKYESENAASK